MPPNKLNLNLVHLFNKLFPINVFYLFIKIRNLLALILMIPPLILFMCIAKILTIKVIGWEGYLMVREMLSILMVHFTMANLIKGKHKINMPSSYCPTAHSTKVKCINQKYQVKEHWLIKCSIGMKVNGWIINLMARGNNNLVMVVSILVHLEMDSNIALKKAELFNRRNSIHLVSWLFIENMISFIVVNLKMDLCMVTGNLLIRLLIYNILDSFHMERKKDMALWKLLKEDLLENSITILSMEKEHSNGMMEESMKVSLKTVDSMVRAQ